jgi:hypothetical protein
MLVALIRVEPERHPELRIARSLRACRHELVDVEIARRDTDDRVRATAQRNRTADGVGGRPEPLRPEAMTDHGNTCSAGRIVVE